MKRYVIERDIPGVGTLERDQLRQATAKSNSVLKDLGTDIQWEHSYATENKLFCIYLAKNEELIYQHAKISGFPAHKVTEVKKVIDPTTAN
jgi:hypothetical protein